MGVWDPFDAHALRAQIKSQKSHAWDIDKDIDWKSPIDLNRYFLPLDSQSIAFPNASPSQQRAISQLIGLIVNSTIGEMEKVIHKLKFIAWENVLRGYPVNPELWELGELFFEEERKHSAAFARFVTKFCDQTSIAPADLDRLLPKAFGSRFLNSVIKNAEKGGYCFWWVVSAVEEVSIEVFKAMHPHEANLDPLYFSVHRRHLEEEARHKNYAFLMLELLAHRPFSFSDLLRKKTDLIRAQAYTTSWVFSELSKVFEVQKLKGVHPFFDELCTCLPLLKDLSKATLMKRLFTEVPFINLVINSHFQPLTRNAARKMGAIGFPFPKPPKQQLTAGPDSTVPTKKGAAA